MAERKDNENEVQKNEVEESVTTLDKEEEDKELERLAVEQLLKDAKRAKERAERVGPIGWTRGPTKTNKRFLFNTLEGTVQANKRLKVAGPKQPLKPKRKC